ncbi:universal stress protein [Spirosoma arcticum]
MTTILVATDFSASAHWATDYALELAKQLDTRLVLVHAYDLPSNGSPDRMTPTDEGQYEGALHQLSRLRDQMLETTNWSVNVSVVARPGSPLASLVDEAAKQQADLLVMSLVGDEPVKARRLGSLATDMIPHTSVPLLLVPPGAIFHKPQNMVLAVDLAQPVDVLAIDMAQRFAHLLQTTLDVVCVEDEPDESLLEAARHIRDLLRYQPHTFSFIPGFDVALALDAYLVEHRADLLILLPKPHSRLRTFLLESNTQEVARLATLPVLAAV